MKPSAFWRNAALILVVINLLFWAWTQGYLRLLGMGPKPVQEPQRMQDQVKSEALQISPPASAASD